MNPKKMRIVFMGTPDFAVGVLDALVKADYQVVATVTAVDKPSGRGKKIRESAVKAYAKKHKISILQPSNLKSSEFLETLASYKADLQLIVAFRMLPKQVWDMPRLGTINLHASLLPSYRGAAPINWAIINGETETGVTTFFIDDKIDTGAILLQDKIAISPTETAGTLHDKLMDIGSALVLKTIDLVAGESYRTIPQPAIAPSLAPKLYKDTCKINWNDSVVNINNKIRGLSPYPVAWTVLDNNVEDYTLKIYQAHIEYADEKSLPGTIITTKKTFKVAGLDGYIYLDVVQMSGKKRMDVVSFLNGFQILEDAKMLF